jgi:hypothetical protein
VELEFNGSTQPTKGDMKKLGYWLITLTLLGAGCAGVRVRQVTPDKPYTEGIRFYRPHPYLWVTKDAKGGLQGTIVYLPDRSQEYVIQIRSGLGTVDSKFTLENGWNLTGLTEARDSKAQEMIKALTGSLKDLRGVLPAVGREELRPGLYAFTYDPQSGYINDLKPVFQFKE